VPAGKHSKQVACHDARDSSIRDNESNYPNDK
jgi:hypothetical protein